MASKRGLSGQFKGIITGASSGIGKAMALDLAKKYQGQAGFERSLGSSTRRDLQGG